LQNLYQNRIFENNIYRKIGGNLKKIVLTGGGTAGHVIPALALLPELKKHGYEAVFIGGTGMEKDLAEKSGVPYYSTANVKFDRGNPLKNLKIPYKLHKGVAEATDILTKIRPDVVFSKGGYAALPTCFAAKKLRIPVVVHESDYSFGLANKIVKKFAALTITSFPETQGGVCLGNPVREEIFFGNKRRAISKYALNTEKNTMLVFGGSLGAERINKVIYEGLERLTKNYNIIHISGKTGDFSIKHPDYVQIRFSDEIADLFAAADVVIARGGANSLTELASLNKPSVIIPLPKGTSRGDQLDNAVSFNKRGFFEILPQEKLTAETLSAAVKRAREKRQNKMDYSDVNKKIVEKINETINTH